MKEREKLSLLFLREDGFLRFVFSLKIHWFLLSRAMRARKAAAREKVGELGASSLKFQVKRSISYYSVPLTCPLPRMKMNRTWFPHAQVAAEIFL